MGASSAGATGLTVQAKAAMILWQRVTGGVYRYIKATLNCPREAARASRLAVRIDAVLHHAPFEIQDIMFLRCG